MKKFIGFLTIIGVLVAAAFVFFTVTPVGKDIWSNITTKVDTVETVDNTDNTDDITEPETNSIGLTKEASITGLNNCYRKYKTAEAKNNIEAENKIADDYNALATESRKVWKDFATLMEAEGLPESLAIIETN